MCFLVAHYRIVKNGGGGFSHATFMVNVGILSKTCGIVPKFFLNDLSWNPMIIKNGRMSMPTARMKIYISDSAPFCYFFPNVVE
jgi:hypothetical protein